jgi:hypothetical protein
MKTKPMTAALAIPEDSSALTLDQLKAIMPARQKQNVTQSLVDNLNHLIEEPEYQEYFRENILGYIDVLQDPNTTLKGYIRAVKYVSYKLMGMSNQESWIKTFPERFQRLLDEEKPEAYIRSLVCAYNKGQLVNKILEQTMVPTWVLNQDKFQKALNAQSDLMINAKSEKVRTDAANSLLTHLRRPEAAKVELEIGVKTEDSIGELRRTMIKLGEAQAEAIRLKLEDAQSIAESKIIEGEVINEYET